MSGVIIDLRGNTPSVPDSLLLYKCRALATGYASPACFPEPHSAATACIPPQSQWRFHSGVAGHKKGKA